MKAADIDMVPQITLMDEMNHPHFFGSKKNLARMKKFMEGKGYAIDRKYGATEMAFKNTCLVITTNTVPFDEMSKIDRDAFMERIALCELNIRSRS